MQEVATYSRKEYKELVFPLLKEKFAGYFCTDQFKTNNKVVLFVDDSKADKILAELLLLELDIYHGWTDKPKKEIQENCFIL